MGICAISDIVRACEPFFVESSFYFYKTHLMRIQKQEQILKIKNVLHANAILLDIQVIKTGRSLPVYKSTNRYIVLFMLRLMTQ